MEKNSRKKDNDENKIQSTYDAKYRIRTQAALVRGEHSHS